LPTRQTHARYSDRVRDPSLVARRLPPWEVEVAEIVLFHSAMGFRPGIAVAAERLRAAGNAVYTPQFFPEPLIFDEAASAMAYIESVGFDELQARAVESVAGLPSDVVYAGFSLGARYAAFLAATRPGARAALLLSGAPAPDGLVPTAWPGNVPAQIHTMTDDEWINRDAVSQLTAFIRISGASCDVFDYPGTAHLFADPSLPDHFDSVTAELMWQRILALLGELDGPSQG
jgi:dienelactone hydrolase